jgi:hypothetical protein
MWYNGTTMDQHIEKPPSLRGQRKRTAGYNNWRAAIDRCTNPKHPSYRYYGAKGIQICERWRSSFDAFIADLGSKPSPRHTLERPNGGPYAPGNVIWGTWADQVASRSDPDRIALSRAGKKSAQVKKIRHREAIESAGQLAFWILKVSDTGY